MAASSPGQDVKDPGYRNGLKVLQALLYMKRALHPIVRNEVNLIHKYLINTIYGGSNVQHPKCTRCKASDIKQHKHTHVWGFITAPCPELCHDWLTELLNLFNNPRSDRIYWSNCDVTSWAYNAWECAKAFMPRGQKPTNTDPNESDAQALLTLMANCKTFHRFFSTAGIQQICKVSNVRNTVMHDPQMKLTDTEMRSCIQDIIDLLEDPVHLHSLPDCVAAVSDIIKIRDASVDVFIDLELDIKAIRELQEEAKANLQNDIEKIHQDLQKSDLKGLRQDMELQKSDLHKLHQKMSEVKDINQEVCSVKSDLELIHKDIDFQNIRVGCAEGQIKSGTRKCERRYRQLDSKVRNMSKQMVVFQGRTTSPRQPTEKEAATMSSIKLEVTLRSTSNENDIDKCASDKQILPCNTLNRLVTEDSFKSNTSVEKAKSLDKLCLDLNGIDKSMQLSTNKQEENESRSQDAHTSNQENIHSRPGTAPSLDYTVEDIERAWPSIEREMLKELYAKILLNFFRVKCLISCDEHKTIKKMTRICMVQKLLEIVKKNLPNAFRVLLEALKITEQDRAYDMLIHIMNGTYVPEIHAGVPDMSCCSVKVKVIQEGKIIIEAEETIISALQNVPKVKSCGALSLILNVERGSVIIHFQSESKHEREALEVFCRHGGMQNFVRNMLKKKNIHASLPAGKVCIDVQVSCHEEDHSVSEGAYEPERDLVPARFEVVDDPQVIKENLLLQYSRLLEETEPIHLQKTFIDRRIFDKSFFEELKMLKRRERMDCFLKKVLDIGSEEAIKALVDALKVSGDEDLAEKLCRIETKMPLFGDTDYVDDCLVKVVEVVSQTHAEEGILWSCRLEVIIGKDMDLQRSDLQRLHQDTESHKPEFSSLHEEMDLQKSHLEVIHKAMLHRTVLNRCLTALVRNLDYDLVSMYIRQKEVLDEIILQDISDQENTSKRISELIKKIQQRDEVTYRKFKECLVQAQQKFLKDMLEEQEGIVQRGTVNKEKSYARREEIKNDNRADKKKGHVMISYSWKQKEKAVWIKKQLETYGFPIWIDEKDMGRELLSSMASAVEGADVVLLCISEDYKSSRNCEREASYASYKKKVIIPLKVEDVQLHGWLGILGTDKVYYNFSGNPPYEEELNKLLQELATYYNMTLKEPEIVPSDSNIVSQEESGPEQDLGANQSTGSE